MRAGGQGLLGVRIVKELLLAGFKVTAGARPPARPSARLPACLQDRTHGLFVTWIACPSLGGGGGGGPGREGKGVSCSLGHPMGPEPGPRVACPLAPAPPHTRVGPASCALQPWRTCRCGIHIAALARNMGRHAAHYWPGTPCCGDVADLANHHCVHPDARVAAGAMHACMKLCVCTPPPAWPLTRCCAAVGDLASAKAVADFAKRYELIDRVAASNLKLVG